jgi:hypothetical protein
MNAGIERGPEDKSALWGMPRLLNLREAARYLGVSYWSVRDYVLAGYVRSIALPPLRPRDGERPKRNLRRVLVDRADLDAFIEAQKRMRA